MSVISLSAKQFKTKGILKVEACPLQPWPGFGVGGSMPTMNKSVGGRHTGALFETTCLKDEKSSGSSGKYPMYSFTREVELRCLACLMSC